MSGQGRVSVGPLFWKTEDAVRDWRSLHSALCSSNMIEGLMSVVYWYENSIIIKQTLLLLMVPVYNIVLVMLHVQSYKTMDRVHSLSLTWHLYNKSRNSSSSMVVLPVELRHGNGDPLLSTVSKCKLALCSSNLDPWIEETRFKKASSCGSLGNGVLWSSSLLLCESTICFTSSSSILCPLTP